MSTPSEPTSLGIVYMQAAGASSWKLSSVGTASVAASGIAYIEQVAPQQFVKDLPHVPGDGPVDMLSGMVLAGIVVGVAVKSHACHFPEGFYFRRSLDASDDP